ncbi:LysR family transcriptional regulator [Acerihabitans sp. TG2]|uniref:LysR family transcriptional regulator n=1 Tax=Acerihabitans sp. TG2 TaxID=3096008 RepID=UPI002B22B871|nr:LysR family transcriptional regulator [Acerihabitans sp. TG2]MEA9391154.1 LysR family transcriptional regulator [Acerihabitans sp. TG2]
MNIELRHLRYFIAVAETLHFGRAAEQLHMSQPPLSQQIQILEQQIGAKLFDRNNRNVRLTPAGKQFLQQAWLIIEQVNQAADRAGRIHRGELGEITIGFTSSTPFIQRISASLLAFRQQNPAVHIQMVETNTKQQIEPLLNGTFDMGVMRNTDLPGALSYRLLLREALVAVVHRDHPLAKQPGGHISIVQLANQPFVFFDRKVGTALYDETLRLLKQFAITPYITQEVGEAMTIIGLVSAGLGVSILPASFARIRVDSICYLELEEPEAMTEVWLATLRDKELSASAQMLINLMLKQ